MKDKILKLLETDEYDEEMKEKLLNFFENNLNNYSFIELDIPLRDFICGIADSWQPEDPIEWAEKRLIDLQIAEEEYRMEDLKYKNLKGS